MPYTRQQLVNDAIENELKTVTTSICGPLDTLDDVKRRSGELVPLIMNNYKTNKPLTRSVQDAIMNMPTIQGVPGQDPATINRVTANLWIGPAEAAAIYSQKGIPEIIVNKKSKSVLLNGVKIKNPRLTPEQLDEIQEDMVRNGLAGKMADSLRDSLGYGGGLMFPMFKRDSPLTMNLPISALIRYGVIGKGCISWFVNLDRWNTVHIPNWNPTARDFMFPQKYYIPFLGCDVSGERCARLITAPQMGYWGTIMTMGWGISDFPGWIESVYNYYNVMSAIPTMINQMSILARTFNFDGILATEGANILEDIDFEQTIKVREMSPNNPISLDVVGSIQAIQRDFKEVPNLVRLIRQDAASRAGIPEELLWSSERGAFSSGDTTEGALEKQWESVKYIHRDTAAQLKNIAMLEVINALGLDRKVLAALPYTYFEFDNPALTDATKKAEFFKNIAEGGFNLASAQVPMDQVVKIAEAIGETDFPVNAALLEELKTRQTKLDDQADEQHDKQMELLDVQIEQIREQIKHIGEAGTGASGGSGTAVKKPDSGSSSGGHSYSSRLEQKMHEKTRGTAARKQALQKAQNKKI
jgi:hypothetical protein